MPNFNPEFKSPVADNSGKIENKKTAEERDKIYKDLLESLKVECPTLDSFYKLINEQEGRLQSVNGSGSTPNTFNLARSFSNIFGEIHTRVESPNSNEGEIALPYKKYQDVTRLKQIINAFAAEVYFGQRNILDENGNIPYLVEGFVKNYSDILE